MNGLYQSQQNKFLKGNTLMTQRALCQKYQYHIISKFRTIYLFQLSQWIKTWIMQSNFSLDLYLSLKCHSSTGVFFTYFANQPPGFSIGGTFGLRLVKNSNSIWKYCIFLSKCPGLNTFNGNT